MLGFAAGIMIAAGFWSLLAPSIEISQQLGQISWIPPAIGILAGGVSLLAIDKTLPHLHVGQLKSQAEGIKTS